MTREEERKIAAKKYSKCTTFLAEHDFIQGAQWADTNPQSPWISIKDKLPPKGIKVIAYHHKWIDEDFNPEGTRIGFLDENQQFTSAFWWDNQDCYETINKSYCEDNEDFYKNYIDNTEPEYWCYIPKPPKEIKL